MHKAKGCWSERTKWEGDVATMSSFFNLPRLDPIASYLIQQTRPIYFNIWYNIVLDKLDKGGGGGAL